MNGRWVSLVAAVAALSGAACGTGERDRGSDVAICASAPTMPTPVATQDAYEFRDLASDGSHLYGLLSFHSDLQLARVIRVPLGAGGVETLSEQGQGPVALALDPTSVYWTSGRGSFGIQRTAKAGGATTMLTQAPRTGPSLVADETGVYWAEPDAIVKRRAAGGDPVIIAADVRQARLALDGARIYWGDGAGTVKSAPREGGPPTVHGGVNARPISAMAVDGQHVYWAADGQLWRSPKQPPTGSELLARDAWIGHIAVDDRAVYWLTETALRKLPKDADTASSLALQLMRARGLALDGCHAYFTTNELSRPGQLWKVRR